MRTFIRWLIRTPALLLWHLVCRFGRRIKRARRGLWKLLIAGVVLFLLSGYTRARLGINDDLLDGVMMLRNHLHKGLAVFDQVPLFVAVLCLLFDLLGVFLVGWLVTGWIKKLPNFIHSITALCIGLHTGLVFASHLQLTLVLSLPVMLAFTLAWTGIGSLLALAHSMLVMIYLQFAMDRRRLRETTDRYYRLQSGLAGGHRMMMGHHGEQEDADLMDDHGDDSDEAEEV